MTTPNKEIIEQNLAKILDPTTGKDIISAGMVSGLQIKDGHVAFAIEVNPKDGAKMEPLRKEAETLIQNLPGVISTTVVLTAEKQAENPQNSAQPSRGEPNENKGSLPGVSSIVAVASGKGGVGKSTTAVNLAVSLSTLGLKTGLLDADIYGPSMPRMLGITGKPSSTDGKTLDPMENFGIKVMSMGFLVEDDTPMIWRGPMVQSALEQMMRDVNWGELDVLVVDMPPGTGDVQLTMAQRVPVTGAVIVSTPQDIALLDARKGLNMFRKVDIPVLGIIENMSYFLCPDNGKKYDIFGHGGAKREAERLGVEFLGEVPIEIDVRKTSDEGHPIVISMPDTVSAKAYNEIAVRVKEATETVQSSSSVTPPKIVIQ